MPLLLVEKSHLPPCQTLNPVSYSNNSLARYSHGAFLIYSYRSDSNAEAFSWAACPRCWNWLTVLWLHLQLVVKVHMNDNSTKSLMVDERQLARDVLDNLFEKTHCDCNVDWCLYEIYPELQIGKSLPTSGCTSKAWLLFYFGLFLFCTFVSRSQGTTCHYPHLRWVLASLFLCGRHSVGRGWPGFGGYKLYYCHLASDSKGGRKAIWFIQLYV